MEDELRALPIGSTLDKENGVFYWQPRPGFVGEYDLVFVKQDEFGIARKIPVNIRIKPRFSSEKQEIFRDAKAKREIADISISD